MGQSSSVEIGVFQSSTLNTQLKTKNKKIKKKAVTFYLSRGKNPTLHGLGSSSQLKPKMMQDPLKLC